MQDPTGRPHGGWLWLYCKNWTRRLFVENWSYGWVQIHDVPDYPSEEGEPKPWRDEPVNGEKS